MTKKQLRVILPWILLAYLSGTTFVACSDSTDNTSDTSDAGSDGDSDGDGGTTDGGEDFTPIFDGSVGDFLWASTLTTESKSVSTDLAVLTDDAVAFVGYFSGSSTVTDRYVKGAGEPGTKINLTSNGGADGYLVKYTEDGKLLWAKSFGGIEDEKHTRVTHGVDGSVIISFVFRGSATIAEEFEVKSDGHTFGTALVSFSSDGELKWVKSFVSSVSLSAMDLDAAADGSFVVLVSFNSDATIEKGKESEVTFTNVGDHETSDFGVFIAKYLPDGQLDWAKQLPNMYLGAGDNGYHNMPKICLTEDTIGLAGGVSYISTFGAGEANETIVDPIIAADTFVAKYTTRGDFVWVKFMGTDLDSVDIDIPQYPLAFDVAPDGSFYLSGAMLQSMIFGEGEANEILVGGYNLNTSYIAKFDGEAGDFEWIKTMKGMGYVGYTIPPSPFSLAVMSDSSVIVGGETTANMIFGEGTENEVKTGRTPYRRLFFANYAANGTFNWIMLDGVAVGSPYWISAYAIGISDRRIFVGGDLYSVPWDPRLDFEYTFGEGLPSEICLGSKGWEDSLFAGYMYK